MKFYIEQAQRKNGDAFPIYRGFKVEKAIKAAQDDYRCSTTSEKKIYTYKVDVYEVPDDHGRTADELEREVLDRGEFPGTAFEVFPAYYTSSRETGDIIDVFDTYEEAKKAIEDYEEQDKQEETYTPDFYDITDINGRTIHKWEAVRTESEKN